MPDESKPACATCRFFLPDYNLCRAHPPRVVRGDLDTAAWWPDVQPHDWCGEHQPNVQPTNHLPKEFKA